MNDLISVIVPVYKVEKYLNQCVDSIINQTYTNLEIILVDDGSPDNCGKICDEYAKKDSRIKVIHKENGGLSDARNIGTSMAMGEFLTYIDSDDNISLNYVEYLYDLIKKEDEIMFSACGVQVVRNPTEISQITAINDKYVILNEKQAFENMLYDKGLYLSAWGKLFKTEFIKKYKFPKGKVYEDTAVIYYWIYDAKKIAYGEGKCYFYINRENSISNQKNFNQNEMDYIENTNKMLNFIISKYSELEKPVNRFYLYSNFRELRILLFSKIKNEDMEMNIWNNIKKTRMNVIKDINIPKRDKIAIIISFFGKKTFKFCWKLYCLKTHRMEKR